MIAFACGIFAGVPAGILIHAWCVSAAMVAEVYRRRLSEVLAAQNRLRGRSHAALRN